MTTKNSAKTTQLDTVLEVLANQHRRAIVEALALQPRSISELATIRNLSLPAIHKHIVLLEKGGLVNKKKIGRTHFLAIKRESLRVLQEWLSQFHTYWGNDSETLENYKQYLQSQEKK